MDRQEDDNSQEELDQEEAKIKEYLKTVPYEVLLAQRRANKNTTSGKSTHQQSEKPSKKVVVQSVEKHMKNTPVERSAKEHISRFKVVFEPKRKPAVDPRYQSYAGRLDADLASKSYSFIPKLQEHEKVVLKKALSNKKIGEQEKVVLQKRYNQVTDSLKANQVREVERQVEAENKKHVAEGLKEGRQVFYKTKKIMKAEAQQRRMDALGEPTRKRLMKEKQGKIESRLQWKGRHYARTANKPNGVE